MIQPEDIKNGQIWKAPDPLFWEAIVQWVDQDRFGLLSVPEPGIDGRSVMGFFKEADGTWLYTQVELAIRFNNGWRLLDLEASVRTWPKPKEGWVYPTDTLYHEYPEIV